MKLGKTTQEILDAVKKRGECSLSEVRVQVGGRDRKLVYKSLMYLINEGLLYRRISDAGYFLYSAEPKEGDLLAEPIDDRDRQRLLSIPHIRHQYALFRQWKRAIAERYLRYQLKHWEEANGTD